MFNEERDFFMVGMGGSGSMLEEPSPSNENRELLFRLTESRFHPDRVIDSVDFRGCTSTEGRACNLAALWLFNSNLSQLDLRGVATDCELFLDSKLIPIIFAAC